MKSSKQRLNYDNPNKTMKDQKVLSQKPRKIEIPKMGDNCSKF